MTIYATGNPVGSTSPKDLIDNSQNLDYLILGPLLSYPDRSGVNRLSWAGIEAAFAAAQASRASEYATDKSYRDTTYTNDKSERDTEFAADQSNRVVQFNTFMDASGYEPPIAYASGILLDRTTKTVTYLGNEYRARGSFIPFTTSNWATDEAKLKLIGDDSLRQILASSAGAEMVWWQHGAEGIARTLESKVGDIVSVRDFMTPAQWADANLANPALDHTAAFNKAFTRAAEIGARRIWINPVTGYYNIKECTVPFGISLEGHCVRPYTAFSVANVVNCGSALVMMSGSAYMFRWTGRNTIDGLVLHGRDRTMPGFPTVAGQLAGMNLLNSSVFRFSTGFGNAAYMAGAMLYNMNFSGNTIGISSLIDSQVYGGIVNANENIGISCPTGAGDNTFIGVKCEWNNGNNWSFFQSAHNSVIGCVTDAAGGHNFSIGADSGLTINGGTVRRGGRVSGYNFYMESVSKVNISGVNTDRGASDTGEGTVTPGTCTRMTGTHKYISMIGVDMTGSTTNPLDMTGSTFEYLSIRDCNGTKDYFDRPGNVQRSGTAAAISTVNVAVKLHPMATFTRETYKASIRARAGDGNTVVGGAVLYVTREGGSAVAGAAILDWAGTGFGVTGSETLSISLVNLATDGSTAEVAVKNAHATRSYTFTVTLDRA